MIRLLQILVQGRPSKGADFRLPSAEGQWGYPQDMLKGVYSGKHRDGEQIAASGGAEDRR